MKKIFNLFNLILVHNFFYSREEINYKKKMKKYKFKNASTSSNIILAPVIYDYGNMLIVFKLLKKITDEENLKAKYFYTSTSIDDTFIGYSNLKYIFKRLLSINKFTLNKIRKINHIKKNDIIISNYFPFNFNHKIKIDFTSKKEVLNLSYGNIKIGDLIYDHYLRFRGEATIDLNDKYLQNLVEYAKILTDKWNFFLEKNSVKVLLLPYTSYLHWGIATRVALEKKITVFTYGSNNYIINKVSIKYPFHTKNFHEYINYFDLIVEKESKIEVSEKQLQDRLAGKYDKSTSYMLHSAYGENIEKVSIELGKKFSIIFLHCFFDSPHIYGDGLFVDFFEWVDYTLTVASENENINFYIKPHPNGLKENKKVVDFFRNKFKDFRNIIFLSSHISNKQLIEKNPSAVFTYYGTVAHEFAYMRIPVITAGDNPHNEFNFLYNPKTIEEFRYYLLNVGSYELPEKYERCDINKFYYMHYLYYNKKYDQLNYSNNKNIKLGEFEILPEYNLEDLIYN